MISFADRIQTLGTENAFKVGDDIVRCEQGGINVIRLNLGEPDFASAENINKVAIENIKNGNTHYTNPRGILSLRESIARQVFQTRGVWINPDQIVVTTGGKLAIAYTMMAYVNPGDEVICPSLGFPIYASWVTFLDAVPVPLQLEEDKEF